MQQSTSQSEPAALKLPELLLAARPGVVEIIGGRSPATATLWTDSGLAVSVAHVMGENPNGRVRLADGREVQAKLLGRDPGTDLAVLQLATDETLPAPLPRVDGPPRWGDALSTLGIAPNGAAIASVGILASLGGAWQSRFGGRFPRRYDVDADLPLGASGGPLLDAQGRVVGINTHGLVRGGTTVPADLVDEVVARISAHGDLRPGFVGVRFTAARIEGHPERERGLLVTGVARGGPADLAEVVPGDFIIQIEDFAIARGDDLWAALASRAGQKTQLQIWRGGVALDLQLIPVERSRRRSQPDTVADN